MGQLDSGSTDCLRVTSTMGTIAALELIITSTKVKTSDGELVVPELEVGEPIIAVVVMGKLCIVM